MSQDTENPRQSNNVALYKMRRWDCRTQKGRTHAGMAGLQGKGVEIMAAVTAGHDARAGEV